MSQENEDSFRKAIKAAERGDPGALGEFMDPDLVVHPDPSGSKDALKGRAEAVLFYQRACESGPPKLYVDDFGTWEIGSYFSCLSLPAKARTRTPTH